MASTGARYQGSLFPQLPNVSQATVMADLRPYFPVLRDTVMEPWDDLMRRRAEGDRYFTDLDEDECGVWLTMQATRWAADHLADRARLVRIHGKLVMVFDERYAVTIKKVTRRLNPKTRREELSRSNYPTKRNRDYWDQRQCGEHPDLPRVVLGYELIEEVTDIRLHVAYPRGTGRSFVWAVPLPDEVGTLRVLPPPSPVEPDEMDGPGFTIGERPAAERQNDRKGGNVG